MSPRNSISTQGQQGGNFNSAASDLTAALVNIQQHGGGGSQPGNQRPRREFGWIQFGLCYEEPNMIVTVWCAEGLQMVESAESLSLPKPYAIVRLCFYG